MLTAYGRNGQQQITRRNLAVREEAGLAFQHGMSALVEGRYDLVPIPDAKLGPRKLDVANTYNTERYRPIYANKRGLPIFLNRAS